MMRIIAMCAGPQHKWGDYLGVPSHLAPVDGEPLIHRTVRQVISLTGGVGSGVELYVTGPIGDDRYAVPGARWVERSMGEASEYHSTRGLWSDTGRTVLLYGDVLFTTGALNMIINKFDSKRKFLFFGRYGKSQVTGCRYGEGFAVSWWPEHIAEVDRRLAECVKAKEMGNRRPIGWLLLRAHQGTPLERHRVVRHPSGPFVEINDLTEDMDFPADYDRHPLTGKGLRRRAGSKA
jgi:hypothetical protein